MIPICLLLQCCYTMLVITITEGDYKQVLQGCPQELYNEIEDC